MLFGCAQSCSVVRLVAEFGSDDDERLGVEAAQVLEEDRYFGQVGDREQLSVGRQLSDLPDVVAEPRRQGRGRREDTPTRA